ncbi:MAG: D-glycero-alpha-D-manno-heptose-1,7-bisphosphate 7-phosphatase [Bacteroidota bacterium]
MPHRAYFLDRDGTLNIDTDFVYKIEEWIWCDGALETIRWLNEQEIKVIVVTNQSGIARGNYREEDVINLHRWVDEQLANEGAWVDGWYMAPHHPEYDKEMRWPPEDRKPGTGMFDKAIETHDIDPTRSWMAGDKITDLKPALELGITPFFLRSRHLPNQDTDWLEKHRIQVYDRLIDTLPHLGIEASIPKP